MSVVVWVESLLGSGHLRRAVILAGAIAARGMPVTIACGTLPPWPLPKGVAHRPLPAVRAADEGFSGLVDAAGKPVDARFWQARRALLDALLDARPKVVVTELFPFGRRAFRDELLPWLRRARAMHPRPQIVASVRDVLVEASPEKSAWMRDVARDLYDRVLVHGDPALIAFDRSFPHAGALADRLVHTGYLADPPPAPRDRESGRGEVLVSAGGGAVGLQLLEAAIDARGRGTLEHASWRLIAGPNLDDAAFASLAALMPAGIALDRHLPDFTTRLGNCLLSISQAGYNTVVEALQHGTRMVLVPFAASGETEQTVRARQLAARGLATLLPETALSGTALAAAVADALTRGHPPRDVVDLAGAERSVALIEDLVREAAA